MIKTASSLLVVMKVIIRKLRHNAATVCVWVSANYIFWYYCISVNIFHSVTHNNINLNKQKIG